VVTALAFLGIVGYFLKAGLGVTGSAIGPVAQQGDSNIRTGSGGTPDALASAAPGEVVVPQTGGAPNEVGGGTPQQNSVGGPPAPVQRLLVELRGRLQANPNDLAALVNLANLYFDAGKYAQAAVFYRRALKLDPSNPDTRTDYATALHAENQDLDALAQLQIVLDERPGFPEALFNQGIVANAIGRRTEAIAAFRAFLHVAPRDQRAGDARAALANLGAS
jgi:TPR repeat protein